MRFFNWLTCAQDATFPCRPGLPKVLLQQTMPNKILPFALRASAAVLLAGLVFAETGCKTPRPPDELAQAVSIGERPVAMSGAAPFFGGQMNVTVTISRGIGRGTAGEGPGGRGGSGGRRKGRGGKSADTEDFSGMDNDQAIAYMQAKAAVGSPMPPVTMHLKIQNKGTQTATVEVLDFESDLGNFAVHPDLLSMAPDQVAEPDPMISQLGVTSDEIPVKVSLKSAGKTETQTIPVKSVLEPQNPGK